MEWIRRPAGAQAGGRVRPRLRERVREAGAAARRWVIVDPRLNAVVPNRPAVADEGDIPIPRIAPRVGAVAVLNPIRVRPGAGIVGSGVHVIGARAERVA